MRLIDADELNFKGQKYNKSQMKAILDFVDAQPTAYDIDKVVEKVERITRTHTIDECIKTVTDYCGGLPNNNLINELEKLKEQNK